MEVGYINSDDLKPGYILAFGDSGVAVKNITQDTIQAEDGTIVSRMGQPVAVVLTSDGF